MILVTGGTGNAGGGVLKGLLELGAEVRASFGRAQTQSAGWRRGCRRSQRSESLRGRCRGQCCLPPPERLRGHREDPGRDGAGVVLMVLLSSSAAPTGNLRERRGEISHPLRAGRRASQLPWTFLQPNSLASNAYRWLPQLEQGNVIRRLRPVPIATIDPDDLGAVAAARLLPTPTRAGPTGSGPRGTEPGGAGCDPRRGDRKDLHFEAQSDEEARAEMEKAMPREYVDAFFSFFAEGTSMRPRCCRPSRRFSDGGRERSSNGRRPMWRHSNDDTRGRPAVNAREGLTDQRSTEGRRARPIGPRVRSGAPLLQPSDRPSAGGDRRGGCSGGGPTLLALRVDEGLVIDLSRAGWRTSM